MRNYLYPPTPGSGFGGLWGLVGRDSNEVKQNTINNPSIKGVNLKMKRLLLSLFLYTMLCCGCAHKDMVSAQVGAKASAVQKESVDFKPDRMLVWNANLDIDVTDVNEAVIKAVSIVEKSSGYLEWKSEQAEKSAHVRLRIPVKDFKNALGSFEALGTVTNRTVHGEDVTEKYIDVEARLKNKYALRERLKQLLDKASGVKDILAIEAELNRVQSDIDSMEGTIKSLRGQIDFATVDLSFKKDKILGPLGYVFKGLWWGVSKLFVLSD